MRPLCIYHGQCADGFGAAWVVHNHFGAGNVDFHAGVYQNAPPDVTDRHVIIVDFSYKRPVMEEIASKAKSLLVLDHHKSAIDDLDGLLPTARPTWRLHVDLAVRDDGTHAGAIFDTTRSGAGITWDFFNNHARRPVLIDHLEDRDLWRFKITGTREVQAAVFSYPYDFAVWDTLVGRAETEEGWRGLYAEGAGIERKHHKDIAELTEVVTTWATIDGRRVPMANLPYTLTSDAGHLLCKKHGTPFAGCWWNTPDGVVFSLRSLDNGADVQEIAKKFGGGGHPHASGFRVALGRVCWGADGLFLLDEPESA